MGIAPRTVGIVGMTCGHCAAAVSAELEKLDGVTAVEIDVESGTATVRAAGPLADDEIARAVREAGYDVAA